jgi:hypothetical protein
MMLIPILNKGITCANWSRSDNATMVYVDDISNFFDVGYEKSITDASGKSSNEENRLFHNRVEQLEIYD